MGDFDKMLRRFVTPEGSAETVPPGNPLAVVPGREGLDGAAILVGEGRPHV